MKPALAYVRGHLSPGDRLYVYSASLPAFDYYGPRTGLPPDTALRGGWVGENAGASRDVERLRDGHGRVWILFTHSIRPDGSDDEARFLGLMDAGGRRLDAFRATGAAVYLYDVSGTATAGSS